MSKWMLMGAGCGAVLAVGVVQLKGAMDPGPAATPASSTSGLRAFSAPASSPVQSDLRNRTAGVRCVLATGVRTLPASVQLRTAAQLRVLPVRNAKWRGGRSVGEIVLPYAVLDEVDWAWEELQVTTDDGAVAQFEEDEATGACVAALPLARNAEAQEIRCPISGGGMAPSVQGVRLWDADLLPSSWSKPMAAADGRAFVLYDVPATGTAELRLGEGPVLEVMWKNGVCEAVEVSVDAELCVHVPGADALHAEDRFELLVGETSVLLKDGVGCAAARIGETVVTQVWHTDMGEVERSVTVDVSDHGRQDTDVRPLPVPTESGLFVWPTAAGPRIVSVNGVAEVAGLRNGDIILAVDGVATERQPVHIALAGLDGSEPSVAITVERNDREIDLSVMFEEELDADDTGL